MSETRLDGKVALVTGAGQGVGLGIATAFAKAGAALVLTGRDEAKLARAAEALTSAGAEVLLCPGDARERASADRAVAAAVARFGRIDVLVNNAQSLPTGLPVERIDDAAIASTLESGLHGTLFHMQAAFPHMKAQGGGSIVNLGSREGVVGGIGFGIYAATKEGIRGLSRVAAREWGPHGIRVNVVNPAALSPAAITFLETYPEEAEKFRAALALGRFGDPETDIGPLAVFLASDAARYVTGQTINADGGQLML